MNLATPIEKIRTSKPNGVFYAWELMSLLKKILRVSQNLKSQLFSKNKSKK